jgi:hypothetical protein
MAIPLPDFESLLAALLGVDNVARPAAENELMKLKSTPDVLMLSLAQVRGYGCHSYVPPQLSGTLGFLLRLRRIYPLSVVFCIDLDRFY